MREPSFGRVPNGKAAFFVSGGQKMQVTVNGESRETGSANITELLRELDITGTHVAVAVNLQVIPRTRHDATPLNEGDKVEIVHAVGGG